YYYDLDLGIVGLFSAVSIVHLTGARRRYKYLRFLESQAAQNEFYESINKMTGSKVRVASPEERKKQQREAALRVERNQIVPEQGSGKRKAEGELLWYHSITPIDSTPKPRPSSAQP